LHDDGDIHVLVREAFLDAVVDCALGEKRRPAVLDAFDEFLRPADVEVGVLLPRKRSVREVLGGRRGADCHEDLVPEFLVRRGYLVPHVVGHTRVFN